MKKSIIIGAVSLAMLGCGADAETVAVFDAECENVMTGERGDVVVKCPITEQLAATQNETPNAMFLSVNPTTLSALDAEHVYVNIIDDDCGENTVGYRVIVQNPVYDGEAFYAVAKCVEKQ